MCRGQETGFFMGKHVDLEVDMELVCLSAGRVMYVRQELTGHEMSGHEVAAAIETKMVVRVAIE